MPGAPHSAWQIEAAHLTLKECINHDLGWLGKASAKVRDLKTGAVELLSVSCDHWKLRLLI